MCSWDSFRHHYGNSTLTSTKVPALRPSTLPLIRHTRLSRTPPPTQVKPELRPSLDEILNHPFLRNGGPPQRFSTAHGLRGSYSSSSTALDKSQGTAAAVSSRTASQKQTPERCEVGDGGGLGGRPPLKTRNVTVETESDQVEGGAHVGTIIGKSRLASSGTGKCCCCGTLLGLQDFAECSYWYAVLTE